MNCEFYVVWKIMGGSLEVAKTLGLIFGSANIKIFQMQAN